MAKLVHFYTTLTRIVCFDILDTRLQHSKDDVFGDPAKAGDLDEPYQQSLKAILVTLYQYDRRVCDVGAVGKVKNTKPVITDEVLTIYQGSSLM